MNKSVKKINLHLISDSTGETLSSVSRAVLSQFENVESEDFTWPLIRTNSQIEKVKKSITENPGIVLYTILENDLIENLTSHCFALKIPCIPVLSRIINEFSNYLGLDISHSIGRQHILDNDYYQLCRARLSLKYKLLRVDYIEFMSDITAYYDLNNSEWDYSYNVITLSTSF